MHEPQPTELCKAETPVLSSTIDKFKCKIIIKEAPTLFILSVSFKLGSAAEQM